MKKLKSIETLNKIKSSYAELTLDYVDKTPDPNFKTCGDCISDVFQKKESPTNCPIDICIFNDKEDENTL